MAGEPQPWREELCAVRDTRLETVVDQNQLGTKPIPANVIGGPDNAVVSELPCRGPTNTEPGAVATGFNLAQIRIRSSRGSVHRNLNPVATAPGSVLLDPQCKNSSSTIACLCSDPKLI